MISIQLAKQLLESNLSLITIGDNKIPNFSWKKQQEQRLAFDEFEVNYRYDGGKHYKDKLGNQVEIKATRGIGIVTGYNNLEVIDIDLKILSTLKQQQDFWNEYLDFLRSNIDDFDNKFVVYKTINNGYHILYRCATIQGNTKIATLKGFKEAIIESRGKGGYVFVYENKISKKDYTKIQEVSELDRQALWEISATYNYIQQPIKPEHASQEKEYKEAEVKVWDDYNLKTSIFDVLGDDFEIVKTLADKYIIKRHGAESAHSGYVYRDSGCMYLYSTGTIYPHEKLISPFSAYTYKNHNGDFSASAKELYKRGFGSRILKEPKEIKEKPIFKKEDLVFPIDIFPSNVQNYMFQCHKTLDSSIDYMGCSFLWMASVIIGNSLEIEVKTGWKERATLWISIVGKAGIGKTPSISNIIHPLMSANNTEIKKFVKQNAKYIAYMSQDKEAKKNSEEIRKPVKTQFIVNDITLEALVDLHEENINSVGVFKDELAGWFKDMNKYRAGSDLEFWLSSWSGKAVYLNRKTAKSAFVEKPFIPVLGGIQPSILSTFYTEENKENGFVDRMLLSFPDREVDLYNEAQMPEDVLEWYNDCIIRFYHDVKNHLVRVNNEGDIEPYTAHFDEEAKVEWKRIYNDITKAQNSSDENEYMKSMLPKQKIYVPRFALIINSINHLFDHKLELGVVTKESVLKAERLSKYFIAMAKKIKVDSSEKNDIKKVIKFNELKTCREKFEILYRENPEINRREVSELLGVSRNTIHRYIKEMEAKK